MATYNAQNIGARKLDRVRQGIDDTIKMIENAGFTGEIESKDC